MQGAVGMMFLRPWYDEEKADCPHCGNRFAESRLSAHISHCGCNPAFVNRLRESGIVGKMFRKYHPRSGSTEYYLVDSVQRQEVPVGGYLIRIPGPPENLMASRSYSVVRRNEYADSNLMPYRWGPCSAEEGREALKMLKEFVNGLEVKG